MIQVYPHKIQSGMSESGSYILMLLEPKSRTQVPIFIGAHEAQSIILAKELIQTRRPMTHELMQHVMEDFGLGVVQVTIDRVVEGVFYATVWVTDGEKVKQFDSRTSDAITLALQNACPILIDEKVLEETGMPCSDIEAKEEAESPTLAQLEAELQRCEQEEDYERAAEIQEKINKMNAQ